LKELEKLECCEWVTKSTDACAPCYERNMRGSGIFLPSNLIGTFC